MCSSDLAADPGNAQWRRDVSVSLDRVGDVRLAEGNRAGALAAYEESLAISRKFAAADPAGGVPLYQLESFEHEPIRTGMNMVCSSQIFSGRNEPVHNQLATTALLRGFDEK